MTVNEFDQLQDALLVGAKVAAMHTGFVTDVNNLGGTGEGFSDADALGDISLEPGTMRVLPGGLDVKFNTPEQAKDGISFAKLTLGQIAAGLGVPQHLVDGDLTGANYSSLRAGLLPFRAKVEQFVYHTLVPQFLDPVFRRVITDAYLAGRLDVPDLAPASCRMAGPAPDAGRSGQGCPGDARIARHGAHKPPSGRGVARLEYRHPRRRDRRGSRTRARAWPVLHRQGIQR